MPFELRVFYKTLRRVFLNVSAVLLLVAAVASGANGAEERGREASSPSRTGDDLQTRHFGLVPEPGTCRDCHAQTEDQPSMHPIQHGPFAAGLCESCHSTGASGDHSVQCLKCHADIGSKISSEKDLHGPVAVDGGCKLCHSVHASPFPHQLKSNMPGLCTGCHTDVSAEGEKKHRHRPVFEGSCVICHDAHAASHRTLLRTSVNDICLECHGQFLNPQASIIPLFQGQTLLPKEFFDGMTIILLDENGKTGHPYRRHPTLGVFESGSTELTCLTCHQAHASNGSDLLVTENRGVSTLCLECHGNGGGN